MERTNLYLHITKGLKISLVGQSVSGIQFPSSTSKTYPSLQKHPITQLAVQGISLFNVAQVVGQAVPQILWTSFLPHSITGTFLTYNYREKCPKDTKKA